MDIEEIKNAVLRRFYDGAFKDDVDYQVSLSAFASEKGIDRELMSRIYDELKAEGFFGICCTSMVVEPSVKALIHCENYHLVDQALVEKQNDIRKRILEACADIYEEKLSDYGEEGDEICQRANISRQDFDNNIGILAYCDYFERLHPLDIWKIKLNGRDTVKDIRRKRKRLGEFEMTKALIGITPQARGHKLEDLLAEVIGDEGWEVDKRLRPEGMEYDIVFSKDRDYFLVSCKWEKGAVQSDEVDLLITRAQAMGCYAGILVSMSGFTANCIKQTLAKKTMHQVVLFGPKDVDTIFLNEKKFTDLLHEKIKQLKHVNKILVDGDSS